jgi:hypothetical protein
VAASYDAEGRLSTYGSGFGFSWRPDGLRGLRTLSGYPDLYFIYDGSVPILELYAGAGGTVASRSQNTFGPLGLISRISNNTGTTSADNAFYAFDERGDTAQRTSKLSCAVAHFTPPRSP